MPIDLDDISNSSGPQFKDQMSDSRAARNRNPPLYQVDNATITSGPEFKDQVSDSRVIRNQKPPTCQADNTTNTIGPEFKDQARNVRTKLVRPDGNDSTIIAFAVEREADSIEEPVVYVNEVRVEDVTRYSQFTYKRYYVIFFVLGFLTCVGVALGVFLSTSGDTNMPPPTVQSSSNLSSLPSAWPSASPPQQPTSQPVRTSMPSMSPLESISYPQSMIVPSRYNKNYDHLDDEGFGPNDESNVDKISQIRVFRANVCLNDDCSSTRLVLSLVITYVLRNCQTSIHTQGAYTTDRDPTGTINLKSDTYITRIELLADEDYVINMKVCTTNGECFGPYGSLVESEPSAIFEMSDFIIKAFFGFSGSWNNALGVYYEKVGLSGQICD